MSKAQSLAKLDALLARVLTRAAAPRRASVARAALAPPPSVLVSRDRIDDAELDLPTLPPPAPRASEAPEIVVEIDVQDTEMAVAAGEQPPPGGERGSQERLVTAQSAAADGALDRGSPATVSAESELQRQDLAAADDEPVVEEAPVSSRRAVVAGPEERLAQMAFGAEEHQPPRHTPPPESGRLPAPSEFDLEITGVRDAATLESAPRTETPAAARELVPQATRARLASGEIVADAIGEAQRFAPSTFMALLDASLRL